GRLKHCSQRGGSRAFAVCSRDQNRWKFPFRVLKRGEQSSHVRQIELACRRLRQLLAERIHPRNSGLIGHSLDYTYFKASAAEEMTALVRPPLGGGHEIERARNVGLQLLARYDSIEHAVFEQELAALEALGQFLPDGLLDDARPGKPNQRSRFGDIQIPQHGE